MNEFGASALSKWGNSPFFLFFSFWERANVEEGFVAPGMPVRTVTTFIPPVAAKSYSGLSGSLTPVHPHLLVHESPHLSQRLRSKLALAARVPPR